MNILTQKQQMIQKIKTFSKRDWGIILTIAVIVLSFFALNPSSQHPFSIAEIVEAQSSGTLGKYCIVHPDAITFTVAPQQITHSYTVGGPVTCSNSGSVSWVSPTNNCSGQFNASNLAVGAQQTIVNTNSGYTGSITYQCGSGGTWTVTSQTCTAGVPQGNISGTACTIPVGDSHCAIPADGGSLTVSDLVNVTSGSVYAGASLFAGSIGATTSLTTGDWVNPSGTFTLYSGATNGSTQLDSVTGLAQCASGSTWNGSICAAVVPTVTWYSTQGGNTYTVLSGGTIPLGAVGYTSTNAVSCDHWELDGTTDAGSGFGPTWSLDVALTGAPFTVGSNWGRTTICYSSIGTPSVASYMYVNITPPGPLPDLVPSLPTVSAPTINAGQSVVLRTNNITNQGTASAGPYTIGGFYIDYNNDGTADYTQAAGNVLTNTATGTSKTKQSIWTVPADAPSGTYRVSYIADIGNAVAESNEANNFSGWTSFTVVGVNPQCSDGADNDADGLIDYPTDPGCTNAADNDETNTTSCTAQTISNCELDPMSSGSTDGTCSTGYTGSCSYTCTNGNWEIPANNNTCTPDSSPSATGNLTVNDDTDDDVTVTAGDTATLDWNTDNASGVCTVTGNGQTWTAEDDTDVVTDPINANTTFSLECSVVGLLDFVSVTVTPAATTPTLTASPAVVLQGGNTTLSWNLNGQTGCTLTGGAYPSLVLTDGVNSSIGRTVNANTTFTLSCTSGGTASVTVEILPSGFET